MRVLLVEDDELLADGLARALRHDGYTVDHVSRGDQVLAALTDGHFDAVLLDIGLPGLDGLQALRLLRERRMPVPVIVISARDRLDDRIVGLDAGADDYLVKPFSVDELRARLRARLRRGVEPSRALLEVGDLLIDPDAMTISRAGEPLRLPRRELALLVELARQPGRVFTRDYLEQALYGWSDEVESNALEVHIHHLRRKLGSEAIKTIRGVGYMLVTPAASGAG
ncbi:response regulator transcription factor [Alcanivorax sp. DSM 26295]|jgi:DNA-binding response OmpR family regulator|uniref:response regulator n=1 Tax=Alloalcanivorax TaxID=3020832 RepID=UPI000E8B68BF|nr:response regulator transcription factor [Alcanivorax sp.]MED5600937.1 response regulator transcription factor [Pseudomonadota bacterium]SMO82073.1 two-component system, OmpR family, response regulator QseB [Alcanivorax sp. DSM 26295]MTI52336.1 response regulator transcription factor [Alcanivorax sp.]HAM77148.1 DNA-binding response regulator [Alcanivorax sp.]|tara:strand:- start:3223 stop:3900 length:678 start_codon:yes stop_codon:yes gene_type:complete